MKVFDVLLYWLGNRQRTYVDGLSLFRKLATNSQREKYLAYFEAAPKSVGTWDHHFTMLVDTLSKIRRGIASNPELYPSANTEYAAPVEAAPEEKKVETVRLKESIHAHEERIMELQMELEDMRDEMLDVDTSDIEQQLSDHEEAIADLKKTVDELSKPGVKVVTVGSMPTAIRKAYDRIKEIAPLYARYHAEIADEHKSDKERKTLAADLCKLDDERRKLWDRIDAWAEGKEVEEIEEIEGQRPTYSDNATVRGYELARTAVRLKSNIKNAKSAARRAKAEGKETIYTNAMERLKKYEQELSEIEKELGGTVE